MSERIEEIKRSLAATTPGEWRLGPTIDEEDDNIAVWTEERPGASATVFAFDPDIYVSDADAEFVAESRESIAYLLKLEQSLQEDIMMLKDMVSTAREERDRVCMELGRVRMQWRDETMKLMDENLRLRNDLEATCQQLTEEQKKTELARLAYEGLQEECVSRGEYESLLSKHSTLSRSHHEAQQTITELKTTLRTIKGSLVWGNGKIASNNVIPLINWALDGRE